MGAAPVSTPPTSTATSSSSPPPILPRSTPPFTRARSSATFSATAWTTFPTATSSSARWSAAATCRSPSRPPERAPPSPSACAARSTSNCRRISARGLESLGQLRREVLATHPRGDDRKLLLHQLAQRQICESRSCPSRQLTVAPQTRQGSGDTPTGEGTSFAGWSRSRRS